MPRVSWHFDTVTETQHVSIADVFDAAVSDAEYQEAPGVTDDEAYVNLLTRKLAPLLFLAMPCHDQPFEPRSRQTPTEDQADVDR